MPPRKNLMPTALAATMREAALYRLMTWLSPAYPVGAFSYSHGLEMLVEEGKIRNRSELSAWIGDILLFGGGHNDAIFFRHAYAAAHDPDALRNLAELGLAFVPSAERRLETAAQGAAFCKITRATWGSAALDALGDDISPIYPIAVGVAAAEHGIVLDDALSAYLHGFAANLVSAGVRLVPLGQTDGQRVLQDLESVISEVARSTFGMSLAELGGAAIMADIASMAHETQYSRLFRS
jgi:urease accessory protein